MITTAIPSQSKQNGNKSTNINSIDIKSGVLEPAGRVTSIGSIAEEWKRTILNQLYQKQG